MFQRWRVKARIQGVIASLPGSSNLNYMMQKYVSGSLKSTTRDLRSRITPSVEHLKYFQKFTGKPLPTRVLELGTGWFPTVPIALYLCGVNEIYTIDVHDLTKPDYFWSMMKILDSFSEAEMLKMLPQMQPERFQRFKKEIAQSKDIDQIRQMMNIHPIIGDARKMDFPDQHFDLIISNSTLEHIERDMIVGIWQEFHRLLTPTGIMTHFIDMSDHYEHSDKSINRYNFLQYDDRAWEHFNNSVMFQNRLRYPDYVRIHEAAGFVIREMGVYNGDPSHFRSIALADQFKKYTQEELLPIYLWVASSIAPSTN